MGDRLLLLDLDSSLEQPDGDALKVLREQLDRCSDWVLSGRSLPAARQRFPELLLPEPKVWITGAGTEKTSHTGRYLKEVLKQHPPQLIKSMEEAA